MLKLDEGVLYIHTREVAIKRAQDVVATYMEGERSLVDELRAERRKEAASE